MKQRRLVSIRRRVPAASRSAYDAAWARLREAVVARGAHAWRFAAAGDDTLSLEFLEFATEADPRAAPEVATLLDDLGEQFGATREEWVEV